jgi:transcriptional regulator GlxA family with amidase domain
MAAAFEVGEERRLRRTPMEALAAQMGAAINSMHDDPAHRWTLEELAQRAACRARPFALRFKETVDKPTHAWTE